MLRHLLLATLGAVAAFGLRRSVTDRIMTGSAAPILMRGIDGDRLVTSFVIPAEVKSVILQCAGKAADHCHVVSNNERVLQAKIEGDFLVLFGVATGRAGLRIEAPDGSVRFVGVEVVAAEGQNGGFPRHLPIGFASEDTADHLLYWRSFSRSDRRYADIRYIYLNGGPHHGWHTWGPVEGSRIVHFIRNSRQLGMLPFFIWYNLVESQEGPSTAIANVRSLRYMRSYFRNLDLALRLIQQEADGELVGMVLEPDFLGYLAQRGRFPHKAPAATRAVYIEGLLSTRDDPRFPDTVQGFVQAVNYLIHTKYPHIWFGWHVNHWASPAGGWKTPIRPKGVLHSTQQHGLTEGRQQIRREATAIAAFYTKAGVLDHGPRFVAMDKYGVDATGAEPFAAGSPSSSTWFWNTEIWDNYLTFVQALHQQTRLPVLLWQLPTGHINGSLNSRTQAGDPIPDLPNLPGAFEDSAAPYFFGDAFRASGSRRSWFSTGNDKHPTADTEPVVWRSHVREAIDSGVLALLFGPGVPGSTTAIGAKPGDRSWLMSKVQQYLDAVALSGKNNQEVQNAGSEASSRID